MPSVRSHFLTALILFPAAGGLSTAVAAQPISITAAGADLRAAYATTQDVAEGKRVAQASCAQCHGMDGISKGEGVPHIAGQRPVYSHLELRIYKNGGRGDNPMARAVKFMSEDALMKVSAYYATMEPAQPRPEKAGKAAPATPDPANAVKEAAAGCGGCHGDTGISEMAGMPSLIGLDPKYFAHAMNAYKKGQRKHEVMQQLVSGLSDSDVNNLAMFYAFQKPGKAKTSAPGKAAAGKEAAAACSGCHGDTGTTMSATTPGIAGQDAEYFVAAMRAYKDGSRADAAMAGAAAGLNEKTIQDLAAFYASQTPQAPKVRKPLTLEQLVERCDRCHGVNGNSTDPRSPAIAAQRADYHAKVLRAYQAGERKSLEMAAMSPLLNDKDIELIAAYYARQRARSVVYVILPPQK